MGDGCCNNATERTHKEPVTGGMKAEKGTGVPWLFRGRGLRVEGCHFCRENEELVAARQKMKNSGQERRVCRMFYQPINGDGYVTTMEGRPRRFREAAGSCLNLFKL